MIKGVETTYFDKITQIYLAYQAEKAKYEDQEEAINTLNSNQTIIFILSATIIIMMVLLYWFFIKWTREDDRPVQIRLLKDTD